MKKALVPGSFDPITKGHLNIIERAAKMFDKVYVTVFINAQKTPRFKLEDRLEMIRAACAHIDNVVCDVNEGMLADYCKDNDICTVVKGARDSKDFDYELEMAHFNRERNPSLDTVILPAEKGLDGISSTLLYEKILTKEDFKKYLPTPVIPIIEKLI